jgi:glycosyltransferase involved in cell wall biosynthesis
MRILYILPFVPWSIRVRSFNLIPRFAKRHTIDLVCLASSEEELSRLEQVGPLCETARCGRHSKVRALFQVAKALPTSIPLRMAYASSASMEEIVRTAIKTSPPDLIYVERWRGLQYVPFDCGIPVLCDPTDSMILYNKRLISSGSWWERIIGAEEYVKFLRHEPALARRSDVTIFCSTIDRDCLLKEDPGLNCSVIPNGVDCENFFRKHEDEVEPNTIIFTGNFGYRPNLRSVGYFMERVLPAVRARCPEVKFLAVGNDATRKLGKYRAPGVELIDFVSDLRPYLAKAAVAVAPMTVGTGVSNKVLEAFAVGTPIVATRLACGDLPVRDGEHLYVADDSATFAASIVALLKDSSLRLRMADQGRALVEAKYDWEVVACQLETLMEQLLENGTRSCERAGARSFHKLSVN